MDGLVYKVLLILAKDIWASNQLFAIDPLWGQNGSLEIPERSWVLGFKGMELSTLKTIHWPDSEGSSGSVVVSHVRRAPNTEQQLCWARLESLKFCGKIKKLSL